ncbi:helix-turn-helix domain-containing protein [Haladaptatus sp. NG-SE-30]
MSLIVVADIAHPDLALIPTIRTVTDYSIQVVPHSATDPETGMFFFLVKNEEGVFESFEQALDDDHTVEKSLLVSNSGITRLYRLCHTDETKLISPKTIEVGGLMIEAESNRRNWAVKLQLPDRDALATLVDFCENECISFELARMYRQDELMVGQPMKLTKAQRTALVAAYEQGYFKEPRDTSLENLADQLEISPTAVGGRLRRGMDELIRAILIEE